MSPTSRKTQGSDDSREKSLAQTNDKSAPHKPSEPPEQQLGDTPVAPWEMPTPAEKQQARPVRRALEEAVGKVDSQEKADEVIQRIETATAGETASDVEQQQAKAPASEPAREVEKAARTAPPDRKPEKVLEETARALATPDVRQREALSQAAQEVLNPEQQGAPPAVENPRQRAYLRQAVLKRLKPLDALDAGLFLRINHLPHSRLLNTVFYGLTMAFTGGTAWYATMLAAALRKRGSAGSLVREAVVPMAVSGWLVEYPIKTFFRRRRPFITIIQAIVIGKKPGHYSFPSGHSAVAFAGAWLLNRRYPRWSPLTYTAASLVAFSRVYLGDHYPGDVFTGSTLGILFAMTFNWLLRRRKPQAGPGKR